ncbi:hypothetical protein AEQU3_01707 [Aequorivita antarctica]|nr:hypothetical protein AEQU3_01707 [Aequorivita antarctica]
MSLDTLKVFDILKSRTYYILLFLELKDIILLKAIFKWGNMYIIKKANCIR